MRFRNARITILSVLVLSLLACRPPPVERSRQRALLEAIESRATRTQVEGEGIVAKVLPDDHEGDRHQRFIVRLPTGQTLLIAHNIDIAPRVERLREGDSISFSGEYEWNTRGGVVHWTHHDPTGTHTAGYIKHTGDIYQ